MPELLKDTEAAEFLSVSPATMRRWRAIGTGPRALKLDDSKHGSVRYRKADLEKWLQNRPFLGGTSDLEAAIKLTLEREQRSEEVQ